jgi:hypothetical protein
MGGLIDLRQLEPHVRGCYVLGILAYPEAHEGDNVLWAAQELAVRGDLADLNSTDFSLKNLRRGGSRLTTRLRQRAVAARIALEPVQAHLKLAPLPHAYDGKWSRRAAIDSAVTSSQADVRNFERRVWRPSVRVLHLAVAVSQTVRLCYTAGRPVDVFDIVSEPRLINLVLTLAEQLEPVLETSALKIPADDVIKLRGFETVGMSSN